MAHPHKASSPHVPKAPIRRFTRPFARFLQIESASGLVLLACTVVALVLANSPARGAVERFWHTPVGVQVGTFRLGGELGHWLVNDVLMAVFFFVVGLEIKREVVAGELRDPRKAALPVMAALGGMLVPAALYFALQRGQPGQRGWGIPMATDIAFVVGVMTVLGNRVPLGLKVMLLSLAIADDIGAVVVIAVFYSSGIDPLMLAAAGGCFVLTWGLNRGGVRAVGVYAVVGCAAWVFTYKSGVHPTIAGVVLGLMTPSAAWVSGDTVRLAALDIAGGLEDERVEPDDLDVMSFLAREAVSPLERLEHLLHPWVGFVVMPLFALANAGVVIDVGMVAHPVAVAVALGLFVGKPVGVLLFSYLAVRLGVARLPAGVTWGVLAGGGCLAGIGFTMSLFVAGLGLDADLLPAGKVGTLAGSVCSGVVGIGVLLITLRSANKMRPRMNTDETRIRTNQDI